MTWSSAACRPIRRWAASPTPLLNTVTGYSELDLAALVFHELAHQEAYDPRDSSYNEAFATAVEEEGVTRYAARLGNPQLLETWKKRGRLRIEMTALLSAARADLSRIYRQRLAPDAMRTAKQQRFARLATDIRALEQREGMRTGYGAWIDEGLNNAHLASVATYYDQVPHFEQLLKEGCGDYLPCLYVKVRQEIAKRGSKPLQ
ncbi:MAG: aminopeptidase [Pseudomonadota bacterium]